MVGLGGWTVTQAGTQHRSQRLGLYTQTDLDSGPSTLTKQMTATSSNLPDFSSLADGDAKGSLLGKINPHAATLTGKTLGTERLARAGLHSRLCVHLYVRVAFTAVQ